VFPQGQQTQSGATEEACSWVVVASEHPPENRAQLSQLQGKVMWELSREPPAEPRSALCNR
jgi:hypothetical protein